MNVAMIPAGIKVLSVRELTQALKCVMEEAFPLVWVSGEISNLRQPASGHLYLTLKDGEAQVKGVMWRSAGRRLRFRPHDGLEVIVRGRLTVYELRGEYQLILEEIQPKGLGALELAFRQLREKLDGRGYFAAERKKPLPRFPRRIALVTSPAGAAVRDILEILGRRWSAVEVWIVPVPVQGDGAAQRIADAIGRLNRWTDIDVLIVGRGGGSMEDLWSFNEECVAEAIFRSRIPIISAVGHEVDVTIADLVADRRALTPSEAAEIVTPHRQEFLEWLESIESQLRVHLGRRLAVARARLAELASRPAFHRPLERLRDRERRLDECGSRLDRAARQRLEGDQEKMKALAAHLESLSPLNVLARGYSLTRTEAGLQVVREPGQVHAGDVLITDVQHGRIRSRVE
jgi:exodeoxyribonuclease VII large subunit